MSNRIHFLVLQLIQQVQRSYIRLDSFFVTTDAKLNVTQPLVCLLRLALQSSVVQIQLEEVVIKLPKVTENSGRTFRKNGAGAAAATIEVADRQRDILKLLVWDDIVGKAFESIERKCQSLVSKCTVFGLAFECLTGTCVSITGCQDNHQQQNERRH